MGSSQNVMHFALEGNQMGLDHYIDMYGPWGFGVASVVIIVAVFAAALVYVYTKAIRPFQKDQAELAKQHADAQAAMAITAQALKETMRDSVSHVENLKFVTAENRELLKDLRREAARVEQDRNAQ